MSDPRGQLGGRPFQGVERAAKHVIVASITIVCATVLVVLSPRLRSLIGIDQRADGYLVGQYIDLPLNETGPRGPSAAVFVRAVCPACEEAAPSLRQFLASAPHPEAVLIVIGKSARDEDQEFARKVGATDGQILPVDFSRLRLKQIPTVVVFDRTGRITFVRSGSLSADDLDAARRMLMTISTP